MAAILNSLSAILNFLMVHIKTACLQVIIDNIRSPQQSLLTFSTLPVSLDEKKSILAAILNLKCPILDQLHAYMLFITV